MSVTNNKPKRTKVLNILAHGTIIPDELIKIPPNVELIVYSTFGESMCTSYDFDEFGICGDGYYVVPSSEVHKVYNSGYFPNHSLSFRDFDDSTNTFGIRGVHNASEYFLDVEFTKWKKSVRDSVIDITKDNCETDLYSIMKRIIATYSFTGKPIKINCYFCSELDDDDVSPETMRYLEIYNYVEYIKEEYVELMRGEGLNPKILQIL